MNFFPLLFNSHHFVNSSLFSDLFWSYNAENMHFSRYVVQWEQHWEYFSEFFTSLGCKLQLGLYSLLNTKTLLSFGQNGPYAYVFLADPNSVWVHSPFQDVCLLVANTLPPEPFSTFNLGYYFTKKML